MGYSIPQPSGNYADDNLLGRDYADLLVAAVHSGALEAPLFNTLIGDLFRGASLGIVAGFGFRLHLILSTS